MTSTLQRKAEEISLLLASPQVDLWKLRELALSEGGLVNDNLRRRAWPKLAGLADLELPELPPQLQPEAQKKDGRLVPQQQRTARPLPALAKTDDEIDDEEHSSHASGGSNSHHSGSTRKKNNAGGAHGGGAGSNNTNKLYTSLDATQIDLDVARCTWHLLTGTQRAQRLQMEHKRHKKVARLIRRKQRRLANLINLTLKRSYVDGRLQGDRLRYYQGYHDVACIVLSVLGTPTGLLQQQQKSIMLAEAKGLDGPAKVLLQISQSHLRDSMKANFECLQTALRLTILPLIALMDPALHEHLYVCDMEPFFALSWIITWFAHEIRDTELVKRLFDAFLSAHPLLPVYLSVAMVTHPYNRQEVLETECDFSLVHQTLVGLPKNSSMVGWKYRPGDGYVSDDEQEEDNGTVSTGGGPGNALSTDVDGDFLVIHSGLGGGDDGNRSVGGGGGGGGGGNGEPGEAQSSVSGFTDLNAARVPFQDVLDLAILYMRRLPPSKLLGLAYRYYGHSVVDDMLRASPHVSLLEAPPKYMKLPYVQADWVRKQRALEREHHGQSEAGEEEEEEEEMTDDVIMKHVHANAKSIAVIAAGFAKGENMRRQRRRRRMAMVVTVAVLAVAVGVALQYRDRLATTTAPTTKKTSSSSRRASVSPPRNEQKVMKPKPVATSPSSTESSSSSSSSSTPSWSRAYSDQPAPPKVDTARPIEPAVPVPVPVYASYSDKPVRTPSSGETVIERLIREEETASRMARENLPRSSTAVIISDNHDLVIPLAHVWFSPQGVSSQRAMIEVARASKLFVVTFDAFVKQVKRRARRWRKTRRGRQVMAYWDMFVNFSSLKLRHSEQLTGIGRDALSRRHQKRRR